ncbi:unnamed protein product [Acanthosepion pharaonis]|uniref:Uncharacterized protein n=1 Tax=Acanthosepion pharaonis TaxID=158019 RepID=A0A812ATB8_ACAPH|nr:unnamed protein product [Sepia pharaonis]
MPEEKSSSSPSFSPTFCLFLFCTLISLWPFFSILPPSILLSTLTPLFNSLSLHLFSSSSTFFPPSFFLLISSSFLHPLLLSVWFFFSILPHFITLYPHSLFHSLAHPHSILLLLSLSCRSSFLYSSISVSFPTLSFYPPLLSPDSLFYSLCYLSLSFFPIPHFIISISLFAFLAPFFSHFFSTLHLSFFLSLLLPRPDKNSSTIYLSYLSLSLSLSLSLFSLSLSLSSAVRLLL